MAFAGRPVRCMVECVVFCIVLLVLVGSLSVVCCTWAPMCGGSVLWFHVWRVISRLYIKNDCPCRRPLQPTITRTEVAGVTACVEARWTPVDVRRLTV